ncbi:TRAP transporter permease [Pseudodonghicola flavimaris]|uniref:TRAP transporter fused permease subunit n=1 Tax=Pseudodonghicola flavimaris TaxID=3050036 RepID=A0ABT7F374_9RHOB|nr:TRAP transporter fused permease subunit [Pseudodonghicola flavimaris]MDK3018884.1 TRAP transporter fused permease subunit [Pseudodonghicola flavimaris]
MSTTPNETPQSAPCLPVRLARAGICLLGALGLAAIVAQTFNLALPPLFPLLANRYYYLIIGLFLAVAFLKFPLGGRIAPPRWYDGLTAALALASGLYMSANGERILMEGWDIVAPPLAVAVATVLVALSLEAVRRVGGTILLVICAVFAAYPLFAETMPGFLWGPGFSFAETVSAHVMGAEGIIGIPLRVVADTLVGFIIFGSALTAMGGGQFFMDFAMSLMGRSRGGPAKVAILSSGLFGSLSGSVISNVLTTGRLTIPAMQKTGYPPKYAAAVEACASTGGTLMPPVMGAVAFIMASFLDTSYTNIMVAALVPSVLYYLALFLQVDLFAARNGLAPQTGADQPRLIATLREGWHHLLSLIALVALLFWVSPGRAAYYATALMMVLALLRHRRLPRWSGVLAFIEDVTGNIAYLIATLCGIGLVIGALSITGVGGAFSRELILYGGSNVFLLLVLGAITSFVLGMGMTVSACYIFLATILAPALVELGLSPIGSHLFVLYWGMLSYITPPVALASIAAAQISGARGLETGFMSMRLGLMLFVLPFLFVYQPALILDGAAGEVIAAVATAVAGLVILSCALEGYLYRVGRLSLPGRGLLGLAGLLVVIPDRQAEIIGVALFLLTLAAILVVRRRPVLGGARGL